MSDIIRLLPDSVANQIAAGEVIQRPASVIKELVENAIDAGAKTIDIVLKDAGRTLIQVIDDGCGMTETDARMAFERHATSKIKQATDLYSLHTMGFRGEALPSIAAVAQIDMRTMTEGQSIGTRLVINGSRVESQQPEACRKGTNLMVKNLFFNIPVRRKFLKKDTVELSAIMREFERLALVNTDVEFRVVHNDVTLHQILPATFKQRIIALFGKSMERQLIPVEAETSIVRISGYISLPEFSRRRGALQYLTVNGRNMRHPLFHKAILQCYSSLIPHDQQPCYFLNFTVDPESIDVNIHPTKNEIKFENEQPIWQILTAAVRESLNHFNAVPAIDFDREDAPEIPAYDPSKVTSPKLDIDTSFNPFTSPHSTSTPHAPHSAGGKVERPDSLRDWEKLYATFNNNPSAQQAVSQVESTVIDGLDTDTGVEGAMADQAAATIQLKNRYIAAPALDGMLIIDQHRAHIAVLYNRYMANLSSAGRMESQKVLFSESLELSPSQSAVLANISSELNTLGFEVRQDSENQWIIVSQPASPANMDAKSTLMRIIEAASGVSPEDSHEASAVHSSIAMSLAEASAIGSGRALSTLEREQLVASLMTLPNPRYTPDGRTVFINISMDDITGMF